MLSIKKDNFYKVLEQEVFEEGAKLAGMYELRLNNSTYRIYHIVHSKRFGDDDDMTYGTYASMWAGYDKENNELEVFCSSFGGMTGLVFDERILKEITAGGPERMRSVGIGKNDLDCMAYTLDFIKNLAKDGIIQIDEDGEELIKMLKIHLTSAIYKLDDHVMGQMWIDAEDTIMDLLKSVTSQYKALNLNMHQQNKMEDPFAYEEIEITVSPVYNEDVEEIIKIAFIFTDEYDEKMWAGDEAPTDEDKTIEDIRVKFEGEE